MTSTGPLLHGIENSRTEFRRNRARERVERISLRLCRALNPSGAVNTFAKSRRGEPPLSRQPIRTGQKAFLSCLRQTRKRNDVVTANTLDALSLMRHAAATIA